jgi:hypothetical protein
MLLMCAPHGQSCWQKILPSAARAFRYEDRILLSRTIRRSLGGFENDVRSYIRIAIVLSPWHVIPNPLPVGDEPGKSLAFHRGVKDVIVFPFSFVQLNANCESRHI